MTSTTYDSKHIFNVHRFHVHGFNVHGPGGSDSGRDVRLCSRPHPPATVITVSGEVDAGNVVRVSDYVVGFVYVDHPLVLDLSAVEFLGVAGARAIIRFAAECWRAEREWVLVSSDAANHMLSLTDYRLPTVGSVDEALQRLAAPNAAQRCQSVTRPERTRC